MTTLERISQALAIWWARHRHAVIEDHIHAVECQLDSHRFELEGLLRQERVARIAVIDAERAPVVLRRAHD